MYLGDAFLIRRQHSDFGTPQDHNKQFKFLTEMQQTGPDIDFNVPTKLPSLGLLA
jgi:hypothetical protein